MKPKRSGKDSTSDSWKKQSDEEENFKKKKQWFHESSQTESEALRAMIGKQRKKDDKEAEELKEKNLRNSGE